MNCEVPERRRDWQSSSSKVVNESSTHFSKTLVAFDVEAETVKSVSSDQLDDIETRFINGEGGDYVLLETTDSRLATEST